MYLDANGLITQANGDGGDKLQREGFWYEGLFLNAYYPMIPAMASYRTALSILTDAIGNLERDEIQYTAVLDPNDVSRDQLVSNVRACGYYGYNSVTKNILSNVVKNYSRYPNNDLAFFQDYGRFIRSFRTWFLYPLLLITDIQLMLSTIVQLLWAFDPTEVDDLNLAGDLAQAQHTFPTPWSFLARKAYKYLRPFGYAYAFQTYFSAVSGANIEFADLWIPIIERF